MFTYEKTINGESAVWPDYSKQPFPEEDVIQRCEWDGRSDCVRLVKGEPPVEIYFPGWPSVICVEEVQA